MFVNKYTVNLNTLTGTTTATTFNIPLNMDYQFIGQDDIINTQFVKIEKEKAINPILDYERINFIPKTTGFLKGDIKNITFNLNFINRKLIGSSFSVPTNYSDIDFNDSDIKFNKNYFKESYIQFEYFDTDNPLTQRLLFRTRLNPIITNDNLTPPTSKYPGQPKSARDIPVSFILNRPESNLTNNNITEGFYLYDYKEDYDINTIKSIYLRVSFFNAKTGRRTFFMVSKTKVPLTDLYDRKLLHIKIDLQKTNNEYVYKFSPEIRNTPLSYNDLDIDLIPIPSSFTNLTWKTIINLYEVNVT